MATMEIDGFINHFKMLASAGHEAKLNMETKLGEIWVTLDCKVGRIAPPLSPSLSMSNPRKIYRSPSYFRRQARRRDERMTKIMSVDEVSFPVVKMSVAEEAKEEIVADESTTDLTVQSNDVNLMNSEENTSEKTAVEVDEIEEDVVKVNDKDEGKAGVDVSSSTEFSGYREFGRYDVTGNAAAAIESHRVHSVDDMRNVGATGQHVLHYPMPKLEFLKF